MTDFDSLDVKASCIPAHGRQALATDAMTQAERIAAARGGVPPTIVWHDTAMRIGSCGRCHLIQYPGQWGACQGHAAPLPPRDLRLAAAALAASEAAIQRGKETRRAALADTSRRVAESNRRRAAVARAAKAAVRSEDV